MLTSLGKVRATNNYVPGSIYIDGKYYSLSSTLDGTDQTEIVAELRKIQITNQSGFTITKNQLLSQLGDEASAMRFIFLLQAMAINTSTYKVVVSYDSGLPVVNITGHFGHIINAYEGTSGTAGTPSIAIELPTAQDTAAPTLVSATVENAQPTKLVLTYSEALTANTPTSSSFTLSNSKTVASVAVSGSTVTITANSAWVNGNVITVSYTPGAVKIKDAAGNLAAPLVLRAVVNNVS